MMLYELKIRSAKGFALNYEKDKDQWRYKDDQIETCANSPEDAAALALLDMFGKKNP